MTAPGVALSTLRTLRTLFLTGERSEPQVLEIHGELLRSFGALEASDNDNYWSTEFGSSITALMTSSAFAPLPARAESARLPQVGMKVRVVDDDGKEVPEETTGNLVLARSMASGALGRLWNKEAGFQKAS